MLTLVEEVLPHAGEAGPGGADRHRDAPHRNAARKKTRRRLMALAAPALAVSAMAAGAQAQGLPSAPIALDEQLRQRDQLEQQRQRERERQLREQQEPRPDVRLQPPSPNANDRLPPDGQDTPCFRVDHLRLTGERAQAFQWLLAAARRLPAASAGAAASGVPANDLPGAASAVDPLRDPPEQRCLGTRGINLVVARMQQALIERGWITTRVLAAPQDLSGGELTLTLVPGRIAAMRGAKPGSPAPRTLRSAVPAQVGDLLNLRDIEQGLENLKRLPSAEADIRIEPSTAAGARPGDSDLVIDCTQRFPLRGVLSLDDSGTRATGRDQLGATIAWDGPLGLNDLAYISLNHDAFNGQGKGTRGYTAHYSLPWGYWLLGATASAGSYHQSVDGPFERYVYAGKSSNAQLSLTRSVHRSASSKTSLSVLAFQRTSSNTIDDTEIENQRRRVGGWGLGLAHRQYIGRAALDLNLGWRQGTGAFSSLRAPEEQCRAVSANPDLACGDGTSRLRVASAEMALNAPFRLGAQNLRYSGLWRAQWNRSALTPQDRFAIGGRYTVRGFDGEANLMGERGWLLRNDIGWAVGDSGAELYLGADYGEVGGPSASWGLGMHLAGAVLGLRGTYRGLAYDVFVGTPVSKPDGFQTASVTAGFSLNYSF